MEMQRGNPLASAARIFSELANGNIGEASRFAGQHLSFLGDEAEEN